MNARKGRREQKTDSPRIGKLLKWFKEKRMHTSLARVEESCTLSDMEMEIQYCSM
jgi:hypothetical protein